MSKEQKIKLDELKEVIILNESDTDKDFFTGFTTKVRTDIDGVAHEFLDEEDTYYRVVDIFDGTMFMKEGRVIDILMSIPEDEYENGDIYAHGYPESRLVPQDHGNDSEEAFVEQYVENFSEVLREKLSDIIVSDGNHPF